MDHHHSLRQIFQNKELDELYISIALRSFALSMINVFIPIYLLNLNYTLIEVFTAFAILTAAHSLFAIPAAKIASRIGLKHSIFLSIPSLIIFYLLLYSLEAYNWPLALLSIVFGISNALFWISYHSYFSKFSIKEHRGKQIGISKILTNIAGTTGPLIGGLILSTIGFQVLFIIVCILLFTSVIPLFFSHDSHEPFNFSLRNFFRRRKIKDALTFIGHGIDTGAQNYIWPIFIFYSILNSFTALGFVTTLTILFSVIFTYIIGRFSDIRRRLVLRTGAALNAIVWSIKFWIQTSLQVYIIDAFHGMTRTMIDVPLDATSYDKADKSSILKYITFREMMIPAGSTILFVSMIFISDLLMSAGLAGAASFLYLLF